MFVTSGATRGCTDLLDDMDAMLKAPRPRFVRRPGRWEARVDPAWRVATRTEGRRRCVFYPGKGRTTCRRSPVAAKTFAAAATRLYCLEHAHHYGHWPEADQVWCWVWVDAR